MVTAVLNFTRDDMWKYVISKIKLQSNTVTYQFLFLELAVYGTLSKHRSQGSFEATSYPLWSPFNCAEISFSVFEKEVAPFLESW